MKDEVEKNTTDQLQQVLNTLETRQVNLFLAQLGKQKKIQLALPDLWRLFQEVFPSHPTGPERRIALLAVLDEAQKLGVIRLPAKTGRCWEKSLLPHLPLWIRRNDLSASTQREKSWKSFPWDERLAWIADLEHLSIEQETFLLQVQKELVRGTFQEPAPLAYRSLQLTGNEKRLKALASTALFHPGRLSLSFLGCITDIPPFHIEILGDQPRALIFENYVPFRIALGIIKNLPRTPYGLMGYGGGTAFEQAVLHLTTISHRLERIEYVGDLDRPGLRTARTASLRAQSEGLPPLTPASGIHQAMVASCAAFGMPKGIDYLPWEKRKHQDDEVLVSWLPANIQHLLLDILQAGRRIPEEVLGPKEFAGIWIESEKRA